MEIFKSRQDAYFKVSKKAKGVILTQVWNLCGLTRKHVIKRFSKPFLSAAQKRFCTRNKPNFKHPNSLLKKSLKLGELLINPLSPPLKKKEKTDKNNSHF
jgi:hypothetical protein